MAIDPERFERPLDPEDIRDTSPHRLDCQCARCGGGPAAGYVRRYRLTALRTTAERTTATQPGTTDTKEQTR